MGDKGAQYLAGSLKNNTALTTLILSNNQITEKGAQHLADALKNNTTLTTVDLTFNQIGDKGAQHLADSLRNNATLTTLDVSNNEIGDMGAQHLADSLRNNTTHIYIDTAAHESLWQGASRGIIHKIKHNSLDDLEENLRKFGSGIIVVDSLYSGKGSIADLIELCNLKEQYNCMLIVDESHSIGLYGQHGRGLASLGNVTDRIDFITGSLAKAYCVRAGFIAG
ncbi:unnamed protein product [Adineta steineri]|uniref:Aminotransferase class I/classII large domain-containing protein n=1 Tax=Adineta steineri TaxID=433720 RepID=A0A818LS40_9BILA|nr:unnamed protein product [Adineta steineri]